MKKILYVSAYAETHVLVPTNPSLPLSNSIPNPPQHFLQEEKTVTANVALQHSTAIIYQWC